MMKLNGIIIERHSTPNTRTVTGTVAVQSAIAILDAVLRIIRVDFTKLDLSEDYPG